MSSMTVTPAPATGAAPVVDRRAWLMLALAFVGFAVNFWAWALISPLGPSLKDSLGLSSFQQAFLVAVPVVVGSLGRIPVGDPRTGSCSSTRTGAVAGACV